MAIKYLNKNVRFQCQSGNAVWFNVQNGESKVKIQSIEILTDDCKLSIVGGVRTGQCNLMIDPSTGIPAACSSPLISGSWNNSSRMKIGEKSVLNSNCSISCPIGGCIKPFKPTLIALDVDDEAKYKSVSISIISEGKNASEVGSEASENNGKGNVSREENNYNDRKNGKIQDNSAHNEVENNFNVEYALCDYKNCKKAEACKYLQAMSTLKETNESKNAIELKENMGKEAFDLYAGECGDIATTLFGSNMYGVAHHHIIPANQCFKMFPEIVKLANFYKYSINKAENGICLPTMNWGYDKQPFDLRKEISFYAMKNLGKQWHKGGHKYSCKISVELDSILQKPFLHYKNAIDIELSFFNMKLNEELRCRTENYEQQAEEFAKIMDHICEKVAKKLRRFEDNPQKSYPYYVSKLAFYFAFQEILIGYEDELFGEG